MKMCSIAAVLTRPWAACIVAFLAACGASWTPVAYTPRPSAAAKPAEEAAAIVVANAGESCVAEPSLVDRRFIVRIACSRGIGTAVVRLDQVDTLGIDQHGEWFRLVVHHRDGSKDFEAYSRSLGDMKRLGDALSALAEDAQSTGPGRARRSDGRAQ